MGEARRPREEIRAAAAWAEMLRRGVKAAVCRDGRQGRECGLGWASDPLKIFLGQISG